ncbi:MAG: hypothetical protein M3328_13830, partial [Chloroflexota bacterium]|nr:hypothetical protein [Chloroflexota bacterium]
MSERLRGFKLLMSFSFGASGWRSAAFLVSGAIMSLVYPVTAYASKLLVDAAVGKDLTAGLVAAGVLAFTIGIGLINGLY